MFARMFFGKRLISCERMETKMEFRLARETDIDSICELVASAVVHMREQKIFQWDEIYPTREDFLNDLQENALSVGVIDGEIAVTFTVNQTCEPEYNDGDWQYPEEEYRIVHRFCVHPKFQGRGVAGRTLRHIEEKLRRQKIGAVRLDTFTGNPPAIALYTGNGYEKRGFADWRKGRFYLMEKKL